MNELEQAQTRLALARAGAIERENAAYDATTSERGEFVLTGVIKEATVHRLIEQMTQWSIKNPGAPLTLVINSEGGNVFDGFALYDAIQHLRSQGHHVTTIGIGMQASMGGVMLQAGDERVMSKHSWLMIHEVRGIVAGALSEMEDDMRLNKRLQDQALAVLAERSTISKRTIQTKWKRKDWWLDADEALKAGFVDRVEG